MAVLDDAGGPLRRAEILERARSRVRFTAAELALAPSGSGGEHHATFVDQCWHWALTNLKRRGAVEKPAHGWWASVAAAAGPERLAPPVSTRRLEQLRSMSYASYLRTPEWRQTRQQAIARAGGRCQLEAAHTGELHVHHSSYRRGEETTADVLVVCESCHDRHHAEHGRPGPAVAPSRPRRGLLRAMLGG